MICQECGAENSDGEDFCAFCGAVLGAKLETVRTSAVPRAENPNKVDKQTPGASNDGGALAVLFDVFSAWKISFSKYFNGMGRASRTEFWYWHILLLFAIVIPLIFVVAQISSDENAVFTILELIFDGSFSPLGAALLWLVVWALVLSCPTVCLYIRRVHDFNMSIKSFFLMFTPLFVFSLIGLVILFDPGYLEESLRSKELDFLLDYVDSSKLTTFVLRLSIFFSCICALLLILVPGLIPGVQWENDYGPRPRKP